MKHGQAGSTQRGARMVFGTTLDELAARNTVGSGRGAWETDIVSHSGVYKAPHDPPLLERPFPLAQFVCHALLSLSQSTHSLL